MIRRSIAGLLVMSVFAGLASAAPRFRFTEEDVGDIVGEVQKPDVTVVISRENLNKAYELDLEESFLQKIVDAVESEPF